MPFLMGKLVRKNGQKYKVSLRRCGSIFRLLPRFINGGSITFEKRVKSCYYIPHTHTPFFSLVEIPLLGFAQLTLLTIKWHLSSWHHPNVGLWISLLGINKPPRLYASKTRNDWIIYPTKDRDGKRLLKEVRTYYAFDSKVQNGGCHTPHDDPSCLKWSLPSMYPY